MFDPFRLAGLTLPNRIVMAPMTRSRVGAGDTPAKSTATYYAQRASAGLIISESLVIAPEARGYLYTPGIYTEAQIAGWREVVQNVHSAGGRMFAQLWHVGRVSHTSVLPPMSSPLAPTDEHIPSLETFGIDSSGAIGKVTVSPPIAMTQADIARTIKQYGQAALNAQLAGFDGVEILAANGYLFEQFLNSACNTRTDLYGGQCSENRCRFLLQTLDTLTSALKKDFPIGVRLSPYGFFNAMPADVFVEETYLYLAEELRARKIAYVHFNDEPISIGHLNSDAEESAPQIQRLIPRHFLEQFKKKFAGPLILCGGLTKELALELLDNGIVDMTAFGVAFLSNPDLPYRLKHGLPLNTPDPTTFYGGDERGYTDYPSYC
jgi:2,4-dienoyl-CoA reductase-like NADH-dependent reductase (Old Yellow Enzyme family)